MIPNWQLAILVSERRTCVASIGFVAMTPLFFEGSMKRTSMADRGAATVGVTTAGPPGVTFLPLLRVEGDCGGGIPTPPKENEDVQ